jgi:hypothetical protein
MIPSYKKEAVNFVLNTKCSIQLSHLLGIYPKGNEISISKRYYTPMLTVALFIPTKICGQLRCPLRDEWIKNTWCTYTMECYSAVKEESCHWRQHRWNWRSLC